MLGFSGFFLILYYTVQCKGFGCLWCFIFGALFFLVLYNFTSGFIDVDAYICLCFLFMFIL